MNKTVEFTVYGNPIAQPRHRIAKNRGRYIPADHAVHEWKDRLRLMAQEKKTYFDENYAITMKLLFALARPKSYPKKFSLQHTVRPDLDNLIKAVKDALQGVIYKDDSQVNSIVADKDYIDVDEKPNVQIFIQAHNRKQSSLAW